MPVKSTTLQVRITDTQREVLMRYGETPSSALRALLDLVADKFTPTTALADPEPKPPRAAPRTLPRPAMPNSGAMAAIRFRATGERPAPPEPPLEPPVRKSVALPGRDGLTPRERFLARQAKPREEQDVDAPPRPTRFPREDAPDQTVPDESMVGWSKISLLRAGLVLGEDNHWQPE